MIEETPVINKRLSTFFSGLHERIVETLYNMYGARPGETYQSVKENNRYLEALSPDHESENIHEILAQTRHNIAVARLAKAYGSKTSLSFANELHKELGLIPCQSAFELFFPDFEQRMQFYEEINY